MRQTTINAVYRLSSMTLMIVIDGDIRPVVRCATGEGWRAGGRRWPQCDHVSSIATIAIGLTIGIPSSVIFLLPPPPYLFYKYLSSQPFLSILYFLHLSLPLTISLPRKCLPLLSLVAFTSFCLFFHDRKLLLHIIPYSRTT